jgi:hypothetical protein
MTQRSPAGRTPGEAMDLLVAYGLAERRVSGAARSGPPRRLL